MIRWDETELQRVASILSVEHATKVRDDAARRVPVDTGELRDSLAVVVDGGDAYVVAGTDHARWVHDGTVDTPAVPFLSDAAAAVVPFDADASASGVP